ncbi:hypothetical protein [Dehalobacter sp. TeCB1]|uniref:hypothetical protein n=1 Tax=Dehalobacter sp. TeCB1 TaxID=1843715 RepID=UPI00083B01FD|nr:hypothetical protein [Dehalobacter sp. TeCB1]OCZ49451.1 hypothetical protein A7D23_03070 [Dehalobacter sp. TeCB1]
MNKCKHLTVIISLTVLISLLLPQNIFAAKTVSSSTLNGKTCSQIGMIPDDASKGSLNYSLLCKELNSGTNILVDSKYFISGSVNAKLINSNINMNGTSNKAELAFTNTTGEEFLFNIQAKQVTIENIRFTQKNNGYVFIFNIQGSKKLDNFKIEHCYFEGNIRLLTWKQTTDSKVQFIDPTVSDFGITHFVFNNNTCRNLKERYKGFIYLDDVPIAHAELIGNDIKNFVYAFYTQGITNENPYGSQVAEKMAYLEVRDNTVTSDNDWDGAPPSPELYHCFIFFEGNKCDYFNNHVEGLHVINRATVVYDAYLSCWDLDYEDNYWKNNISFSATKSNAELMKSKSATKRDYHGINRLYKNNTYIVEKSYADIFNRPYDELWVSLSYYQHEMDTVVVENNTFDVYKLAMPYGQPIHNYTFSNNTIHAYMVNESFNNCILPAYRLDNPSPTDTYIARDNHIVIKTPAPYSEKQNSLIMTVGNKNEVKTAKIIFENNYIEWPDLKAVISSPLGINLNITCATITNNSVVATRPGSKAGKTLYTGLYVLCDNLSLKDTSIQIPTTEGYSIQTTPYIRKS